MDMCSLLILEIKNRIWELIVLTFCDILTATKIHSCGVADFFYHKKAESSSVSFLLRHCQSFIFIFIITVLIRQENFKWALVERNFREFVLKTKRELCSRISRWEKEKIKMIYDILRAFYCIWNFGEKIILFYFLTYINIRMLRWNISNTKTWNAFHS